MLILGMIWPVIEENGMYKACTEGALNYQSTHHHCTEVVREVRCDMCKTTFRRAADKTHHWCLTEHQKPIQDQQVQYNVVYIRDGLKVEVA